MKKEKISKDSVFEFIKNTLVNPIKNMDKNTKELNTPKKTLIFASILSVVMMTLNLVTTMLNSIFVESCDFWTSKCKTKIVFDNLGNLDYLTLIFKYLLMYGLFTFGVAFIYYIVSLMYKKNINYIKVLGITLVAFVPNILLSMVAGEILGILYGPLRMFLSVLGNIYTILILVFSLKDELKLNDTDKLIIYSVVCVTLLYILKYYVFIKLIFI